MPTIVVSLDGAATREVPLTKERTTLGRRPYNDVVIDHPAVSGEHAVLLLQGGSVEVEDLGSTNGTYVNGQRIQRQMLRDGDTVEAGRYSIRLQSGAAPGFEATQQPAVESASQPSTVPSGAPCATVRVLGGPGAGREVTLSKVVTTIGKPGVAVASITRRHHGYVLAHVEGLGQPLLNGIPVAGEPIPLAHGDRIALAGAEMEFVLG